MAVVGKTHNTSIKCKYERFIPSCLQACRNIPLLDFSIAYALPRSLFSVDVIIIFANILTDLHTHPEKIAYYFAHFIKAALYDDDHCAMAFFFTRLLRDNDIIALCLSFLSNPEQRRVS
jgi:hypothetical protein